MMTQAELRDMILGAIDETLVKAEGRRKEKASMLTASDLAKTFRIRPATVLAALKSEELPGRMVGSTWHIRLSDAEAWREQYLNSHAMSRDNEDGRS